MLSFRVYFKKIKLITCALLVLFTVSEDSAFSSPSLSRVHSQEDGAGLSREGVCPAKRPRLGEDSKRDDVEGSSVSMLSSERSGADVVGGATSSCITPHRPTSAVQVDISPESKGKKSAIYLIHDFEGDKLDLGPKVDLEFSDSLNEREMTEKLRTLIDKVLTLKQEGGLYQFHRYIGLVSSNEKDTRTTYSRYQEHCKTGNRLGKESERRLYLGLKKNKASHPARLNKMTVLVFNVNGNHLKGLEAYLIQLFGGLEDLGWNSQRGNYEELCKVFPRYCHSHRGVSVDEASSSESDSQSEESSKDGSGLLDLGFCSQSAGVPREQTFNINDYVHADDLVSSLPPSSPTRLPLFPPFLEEDVVEGASTWRPAGGARHSLDFK